ncbi:MAG: serine protease, partial [Microbacterium hominis]|nr:serine protease [Microbacterium hominis]
MSENIPSNVEPQPGQGAPSQDAADAAVRPPLPQQPAAHAAAAPAAQPAAAPAPQAGAQPYASQAPYTAPSAPAYGQHGHYGQHGQYGQQPTAAYATAPASGLPTQGHSLHGHDAGASGHTAAPGARVGAGKIVGIMVAAAL